jgi:hypothetical protein
MSSTGNAPPSSRADGREGDSRGTLGGSTHEHSRHRPMPVVPGPDNDSRRAGTRLRPTHRIGAWRAAPGGGTLTIMPAAKLVTCLSCGFQKNPPGSSRCASCGAKMEDLAKSRSAAREEELAGRYQQEGVSVPLAGHRLRRSRVCSRVRSSSACRWCVPDARFRGAKRNAHVHSRMVSRRVAGRDGVARSHVHRARGCFHACRDPDDVPAHRKPDRSHDAACFST